MLKCKLLNFNVPNKDNFLSKIKKFFQLSNYIFIYFISTKFIQFFNKTKNFCVFSFSNIVGNMSTIKASKSDGEILLLTFLTLKS